jgi:hypothetical protein
MLAGELVDRAATVLNDTDNVRWTRQALLDFLAEGQRQVALARPQAAAVTQSVALVAGTRQTLPQGGRVVLDVVRNLGADGQTPGRPVLRTTRGELDACEPDWHLAEAGSQGIEAWMQDPAQDPPGVFHVHPGPALGQTLYVEAAYGTLPEAPADENATLGVDEAWSGPLLDWMLYRAFAVDMDSKTSAARSQAHYVAFLQAMGQGQSLEQGRDRGVRTVNP